MTARVTQPENRGSDQPLAVSASPPRAEDLRSFWCLFVTQFQGAFSDNVFKFLVIFLVSDMVTPAVRDQYISVVLAVFSLPFLLFSMAGGFLADRFSKRSVVIGTKMAEVLIMALGTVALVTRALPLLVVILFFMSAQSAFFGPSKYGLLPELLPSNRLAWGNGFLGLGTFLAIISGGVVAGLLYQHLGQHQLVSGLVLVGLALVGLSTGWGIARLPAADPQRRFRVNFLRDLWANIQRVRADRVLALAILGSVYFWFLGALFGEPTIFIYSRDVLQLSETQIALMRACLAVGIALGSGAAGLLSGRKIEYGLVPLGAMGMTTCAALLGVRGLTAVDVAVLLGLLGFSGGFYIVPINALIQHRPDPQIKGSIIATNAWLTSAAVFVASGAFWLLRTVLGLHPASIFLVGASTTLLGTILALRQTPDALVRLLLWLGTHTLYRIRVLGRDNIPARGGALLVCNHLSLADGLLLQASVDRPTRFLMYKGFYEKPLLHPWARALGAIPISSDLRPREMLGALKTAADALRAGEVVCIFAEGQITRIGQLLPFRRGFQRIMRDVDAPIVPVALDGLWGSLFSLEHGHFTWKWPRRLPHPVTINFGQPLPPTATPFEVRQRVQELMAQAWRCRKAYMQPIGRTIVRSARRHAFRYAMADSSHPPIRFLVALARAVFLARRLHHVWAGQDMVGLLLPPCVPGALANWAALLAGKVPVNLNYTLAAQTLASCVRQCGIQTVLTVRPFWERFKFDLPARLVFLEDVARGSPADPAGGVAPPMAEGGPRFTAPSAGERLAALVLACFCPVRLLERVLGRRQPARLDDTATVIFSSGSTGDPKGVLLSHYNLMSNVQQLDQVFGLRSDDRVLGVLPFFHSFGFTGTLLQPALLGLGVVFHVSPLDARAVGELVLQHRVTLLLATPTFLQLYLRGCAPEQFGSLRRVIVGAEKMPERLATAFEDRFGIRPLEAYGCTECAPAVSVNTHDFRAAGFRQVGAKRGSIGHPLPGMCVRVVDPATGAPMPVGQPGLLLVRGPNVMSGYLGRPEQTAAVLRDGWYVTGDVATLDEDGFLQITDRLSRFSKIGGEMVPHLKVEQALHELAETSGPSFVVTAVADAQKGERLVVLHTLDEEALSRCLERLARADLPNLWKPKPDAFFRVDAFPLLGSGKLDLQKVRALAAALAS